MNVEFGRLQEQRVHITLRSEKEKESARMNTVRRIAVQTQQKQVHLLAGAVGRLDIEVTTARKKKENSLYEASYMVSWFSATDVTGDNNTFVKLEDGNNIAIINFPVGRAPNVLLDSMAGVERDLIFSRLP